MAVIVIMEMDMVVVVAVTLEGMDRVTVTSLEEEVDRSWQIQMELENSTGMTKEIVILSTSVIDGITLGLCKRLFYVLLYHHLYFVTIHNKFKILILVKL